jgi:hypothetical protein
MRNKPELSRQGGRLEFGLFGQPLLTHPPPPPQLHPTCFHLNHWYYLLSPQKLCQVPKARAQFHGGLTGLVQLSHATYYINSGLWCFLKWPHWELFCACLCVCVCARVGFFLSFTGLFSFARLLIKLRAPPHPPLFFFYFIKKKNWKFFLLVFLILCERFGSCKAKSCI